MAAGQLLGLIVECVWVVRCPRVGGGARGVGLCGFAGLPPWRGACPGSGVGGELSHAGEGFDEGVGPRVGAG